VNKVIYKVIAIGCSCTVSSESRDSITTFGRSQAPPTLFLGFLLLGLCQFILDLIRCRDWYASDDKCILDRDKICKVPSCKLIFVILQYAIVICVIVLSFYVSVMLYFVTIS